MTVEEYDILLESQNFVCAICGGVNPNNKRLCVDHNHETGQVRGLLCDCCNRGIGQLKDSIRLVSNALEYLIRTSR
jgi:hypothetical protein